MLQPGGEFPVEGKEEVPAGRVSTGLGDKRGWASRAILDGPRILLPVPPE